MIAESAEAAMADGVSDPGIREPGGFVQHQCYEEPMVIEPYRRPSWWARQIDFWAVLLAILVATLLLVLATEAQGATPQGQRTLTGGSVFGATTAGFPGSRLPH